ncbi:MAG TPA: NAD-dependent epimerase [Gemmatimonadales bacterium]|jgi:UDP-glucuronate 4-epimerase|nr:NAD-dependent epimerase [Gemmatimonadales bacterium]
MKYLVTGAAGFIGYHVSERLLARGDEVVGLDNINPYYDPTLKHARLDRLRRHAGFRLAQIDLADAAAVKALFEAERFQRAVNLAAQAGVRYSVTHPHAYVSSNVTGFLHVLEGCRHTGVEHLVYASTSSVYGLDTAMPFSTHQEVNHPASLYAATKKANELMAHSYSHLYGLSTTGLRFFTVYGPWGRPDMALFLFTKAMLEGKPIEIFNNGRMQRDFTYVDDIVEGVVRVSDRPARPDPAWDSNHPDPASSSAPYRLYNIGNNQPTQLMGMIEALERELGMTANKVFAPMQLGDVPATAADVEDLIADCGFNPGTDVAVGVARFVEWYRSYYGV